MKRLEELQQQVAVQQEKIESLERRKGAEDVLPAPAAVLDKNHIFDKKEDKDKAKWQAMLKVVDSSLYLDSVRDTLTGATLRTPAKNTDEDVDATTAAMGERTTASMGNWPYNATSRWLGDDWCEYCFTMAGGARVQNVRDLVERTVNEGIPGDFLEAGTWRGGNSIMARVVQRLMGQGEKRKTYVCDSFSGLPPSSQKKDGDFWSKEQFLQVSQSEVEDNFRSFKALDSNVHFRKGYFVNTLPLVRQELTKQGRNIAVLRGDGDMYESYMDILYNLYDLVPVGGYFICDDCPGIAPAQQAIDDFRQQNGITDKIDNVDGSSLGTFWKKTGNSPVNYKKYLEWNSTRVFKPSPADDA